VRQNMLRRRSSGYPPPPPPPPTPPPTPPPQTPQPTPPPPPHPNPTQHHPHLLGIPLHTPDPHPPPPPPPPPLHPSPPPPFVGLVWFFIPLFPNGACALINPVPSDLAASGGHASSMPHYRGGGKGTPAVLLLTALSTIISIKQKSQRTRPWPRTSSGLVEGRGRTRVPPTYGTSSIG